MNDIDKSRRTRFWLSAIGSLALLLTAGSLQAQPSLLDNPSSFVEKRSHSPRQGVSLDEAVSRVRQQTNGKILSAETVVVDGRSVHRIKVLTDTGRVRRLQLDANSGGRVPRRR